MAVLYRKYQNMNPNSKTHKKWYGKFVGLGVVTTKMLAQEIAHSTTVTYADVIAVLAEMSECMKRHLQNSQRVDLDGIGQFKVGLRTRPADTAAEFTAANISGYRINYQPEVHFVLSSSDGKTRNGYYAKELLDGVTAREAPKYMVDDGKKTGSDEGQ